MNHKTLTKMAMIAVVVMLITGCSMATNLLPKQASNLLDTVKNAAAQATPLVATPQIQNPPLATDLNSLAAYQTALEQIYEKVNPSVVNIRAVQKVTPPASGNQLFPNIPDMPFFNLPGLPQAPATPSNPQTPQYGQALGSGFVWDKQGHIITNNHVIDGADQIEVTFYDGTSLPAKLVGADPDSDLAVIQVDAPAGLLQPVEMADSSQVKVGQIAIAIGNPFGLNGSMTVGIISALGRTLPADQGINAGPTYSIPDIIQTDAAINPGNSGGVLVNSSGQVVGVTAAIESPVQANAGIGFVIPANIVSRVVPVLIQKGKYEHSWLGISGMSLTPDIAGAMGLKDNQRGALVVDVIAGSPAEKAGLRGSDRQVTIQGQSVAVGGDVIIAVDGQPVKEMNDLISYLSEKTEVGQKITLTILRGGRQMDVSVTLAARPASTSQPQQANQPGQGAFLGIAGISMNAQIAEAMNLSSDQTGVLIQQVEPGSPADAAGLQGGDQVATINGQRIQIGGDVITAIDGQAVANLQDLRQILQEKNPGDVVLLTILRDGKELQIQVTLAGSQ